MKKLYIENLSFLFDILLNSEKTLLHKVQKWVLFYYIG